MRWVPNISIAAALALLFCAGIVRCAHGHSLVFGPELISGESGKTQRVVKKFSVEDTGQEFFISMQTGSGRKPGSGAININGKPVFRPAVRGKQHRLLTQPIKLQKLNEISVDLSGEAAPVIVTIMSLKEQTVTARIPPIGEAVDLDGYASIIFPAGTFENAQDVRISVSASPSVQDIFQASTAGLRLPYEIRINSGDKAPAKDIEVSVVYPDSFFASHYQIHVFAHMHDHPDEPEMHDRFFLINSGLDDQVSSAMATLPKQAFSNRRGKKGTYEAIITLGLVP